MHIDIVQVNTTAGPSADHVPRDFFIDKFIENNSDNIDILSLRERLFERLEELLTDERQELERQLDGFENGMGERLTEALISPIESEIRRFDQPPESVPKAWKFSADREEVENSVVAIRPNDQSRGGGTHFREMRGGRVVRERRMSGEESPMLIIVSNSQTDVSTFIDEFQVQIAELESMYNEFVRLDGLHRGDKIVRDYFNQLEHEGSYVSNWYVGETEDEFEQEVYSTVRDLTGVCLPNVNVESTVGESPEYDVVTMPIGNLGQSFAVEAKDYDRDTVDSEDVRFDSLRGNLITQPKEEADRVSLDLITVVRGLTDEQYNDLERHAEPSNVLLLNEDNYEEELENLLIYQNLRRLPRLLE